MRPEGSDVISLECSATVLDTIFFMKRNKIRRIVVTCDSKVAGLFTVDEAIKRILERSVETTLRDSELKRAVYVSNNDVKEVVRKIVENSVDAVLFRDKIITEKDVVSSYAWSYEDKIYPLSRKAVTVEGFTKALTAAEIMARHGIRHLPVVEEVPLGMLSSRDLVYRYSEKLTLSEDVKQIMVPFLVFAQKDHSLREAVEVMLSRGVGSLVFREESGLYIVTFKDLIKYIYRRYLNELL